MGPPENGRGPHMLMVPLHTKGRNMMGDVVPQPPDLRAAPHSGKIEIGGRVSHQVAANMSRNASRHRPEVVQSL